ncbi:hypothetical protein [Streptomyces sp. NPDC048442]|uniref:hypothetical protein n=1 Tax=Streptomyces sp. NPDC048442 TaxID=3154823 RepID=UPI0034134596
MSDLEDHDSEHRYGAGELMHTGSADTAPAESGVGFGDFYRAHAAPLVALLLLRGTDLVEAVRLAQDAMTVARRWTELLGTSAGVDAQGLRAWTLRMAAAGGTGATTAPSPLLGAGAESLPLHARTAAVHAPVGELNERQLDVLACRLTGCPPGAIGYELGLSMPKVHRTLRHIGKLLGAGPQEGERDDCFVGLLAELVAALDPVLDLEAGLDQVNGETGASTELPPLMADFGPIPVPPYGVPLLHTFAEPVPSGVRAYAADLAVRDAPYRDAERERFPVAELAAVRLGAVFALQVERFRRESELSGFRTTRDDFTMPDAHAFARALAQDALRAAPMFDAVKNLDVPRRAGFLAKGLAHDDPYTIEVSYDGIELSSALAQFRRAALELALRAMRRPGVDTRHEAEGPLADTLRNSLLDTHRMLHQLDALGSDLSLAESTLPDGYYVDMNRDFDLHQAFHADLALGIEAAFRAG